jgi:hypothetical protein
VTLCASGYSIIQFWRQTMGKAFATPIAHPDREIPANQ